MPKSYTPSITTPNVNRAKLPTPYDNANQTSLAFGGGQAAGIEKFGAATEKAGLEVAQATFNIMEDVAVVRSDERADAAEARINEFFNNPEHGYLTSKKGEAALDSAPIWMKINTVIEEEGEKLTGLSRDYYEGKKRDILLRAQSTILKHQVHEYEFKEKQNAANREAKVVEHAAKYWEGIGITPKDFEGFIKGELDGLKLYWKRQGFNQLSMEEAELAIWDKAYSTILDNKVAAGRGMSARNLFAQLEAYENVEGGGKRLTPASKEKYRKLLANVSVDEEALQTVRIFADESRKYVDKDEQGKERTRDSAYINDTILDKKIDSIKDPVLRERARTFAKQAKEESANARKQDAQIRYDKGRAIYRMSENPNDPALNPIYADLEDPVNGMPDKADELRSYIDAEEKRKKGIEDDRDKRFREHSDSELAKFKRWMSEKPDMVAAFDIDKNYTGNVHPDWIPKLKNARDEFLESRNKSQVANEDLRIKWKNTAIKALYGGEKYSPKIARKISDFEDELETWYLAESRDKVPPSAAQVRAKIDSMQLYGEIDLPGLPPWKEKAYLHDVPPEVLLQEPFHTLPASEQPTSGGRRYANVLQSVDKQLREGKYNAKILTETGTTWDKLGPSQQADFFFKRAVELYIEKYGTTIMVDDDSGGLEVGTPPAPRGREP